MTTTVPVNRDERTPSERLASQAVPLADWPPSIEVRNISKRFRAMKALTDVSLKLRPALSAPCWAKTGPARARGQVHYGHVPGR